MLSMTFMYCNLRKIVFECFQIKVHKVDVTNENCSIVFSAYNRFVLLFKKKSTILRHYYWYFNVWVQKGIDTWTRSEVIFAVSAFLVLAVNLHTTSSCHPRTNEHVSYSEVDPCFLMYFCTNSRDSPVRPVQTSTWMCVIVHICFLKTPYMPMQKN